MSIDFETYSEAGYIWSNARNRWLSIAPSPPHGIGAVGAAAYAAHHSTEVLCLAYNIGAGPRLWLPDMPDPVDLFDHIRAAGSLSAWNCSFEYWIWHYCCPDWPPLPWWQLRDNMPTARAHSWPGKLSACADAMQADELKDSAGTRLINKFCKPRQPTKNDPRRRTLPSDDPVDADRLYRYCLQDIATEQAIGDRVGRLSAPEQGLWRVDQSINARGVAVDRAGVLDCCSVINQVHRKYTAELQQITAGAVVGPSRCADLLRWLSGRGLALPDMTDETVTEALAGQIDDPAARRSLEIRQSLSNASCKKVHSIARRMTPDDRLHDLFAFCGADRTGRWAGRGPQPQNLTPSADNVDHLLSVISSRCLDTVERACGDALQAVSGCLRGLFVAGPGMSLICSDYSAIEAVVLACLAGEQWRIDLFRQGGHIYETTAAMLSGLSVDVLLEHARIHGEHHPLRKQGKTAELASGYGGGVQAWRQFGATGTDEQIKSQVKIWRRHNPRIVQFWYDVEDCTRYAINNPGYGTDVQGLTFRSNGMCLTIELLSGRCLHYQQPHLVPHVTPWGAPTQRIQFYSYRHAGGWQVADTFGAKIVENITQATARDILGNALINLEQSGYPPVLHVHDEPVSEIPTGYGSVEQYEQIMCDLPAWCAGWPVRAGGGWTGQRYRK